MIEDLIDLALFGGCLLVAWLAVRSFRPRPYDWDAEGDF